MTTKRSGIPPASAPMCDAARAIPNLRQRLAHYWTCRDPRCAARHKAAVDLANAIIAERKSHA